jgi:hypothetical protein
MKHSLNIYVSFQRPYSTALLRWVLCHHAMLVFEMHCSTSALKVVACCSALICEHRFTLDLFQDESRSSRVKVPQQIGYCTDCHTKLPLTHSAFQSFSVPARLAASTPSSNCGATPTLKHASTRARPLGGCRNGRLAWLRSHRTYSGSKLPWFVLCGSRPGNSAAQH